MFRPPPKSEARKSIVQVAASKLSRAGVRYEQ